jgi:hypothetical protein
MVVLALGGPSSGTRDELAPQAEKSNVTNPANATEDDLVKNASIIFRGTVEKVKAATLEEVDPTDETLVVKVDQVLHGTPAFRDYAGQAVTVQVTAPPVPAVGRKATFYVNSWLSGDSLAVKGVARVEDAAPAADAGGQTAAALQRKADQALRERLAAAQLVVVGKVTAVRPVPSPAVAAAEAALNQGQGTRVSEHDPDWREADIQVAQVAKGQLAAANNAKTITVVFPASKDVLWYQVPKFQVGQEGTFLLHRTPANPAAAAIVKVRAVSQPDTYAVPEPADVLPKDQAQRVSTLLQAR